jgi:nucleotide-binding universal stress UspA family protein
VPGTIVLGYDASPGARGALDRALELASTFGDRLVIGYGIAPPGLGGGEAAETREALRERAVELTGDALVRARDAGVEAEIALVDERPAAALVSLGEKHDARMIVVGSYGEHPIKGAILGSTPHKLLHLAECPVLVVPGR